MAKLNAYIFFPGNCSEAVEFYKSVLGGEATTSKYGDMPTPGMEDMADKIMHAHLKGGVVDLMLSDGTRTEAYPEGAISLSINGTVEDDAKLREVFAALAEGGKIDDDLKMQPWGDVFGNLTDKYGINWLVNIEQA